MRSRIRRYSASGAVLVALAAVPARGAEHREAAEGAPKNLVGVKVGHLSVFEAEEEGQSQNKSFLLLGAVYERSLVHEVLEVELSLPVAFSIDRPGEVTAPIDLHLKLPLPSSGNWSPYLAAGPTVDVVLDHSEDPLWGVSVAAGTYVWFSDHVGLDLEVDYNAVFGDGKTAHELLFATGPVYRF